jgi:MipA family protein
VHGNILAYSGPALKILFLLPYLFLLPAAVAKDFSLESKPLYEFGMGGGGGYLTDYPASDQSHWRGVPYPYFIYRGAIFRSDQKRGTRARLISTKSYELALSGAGSFPANSDENVARMGMPDLDWMFEVGPRLVLELNDRNDSHDSWHTFVNLPVRFVFSTDTKTLESQGYTFTPEIVFEKYGLAHRDSRLTFEIQMNFADQTLGKYFYEVQTPYVRADRPAYAARAGYMGTDFQVRFLHPIGEGLRAHAGLGTSYYAGAVNDGSPLFRSLWGYDFSAGVIWIIGKSEEVASDD